MINTSIFNVSLKIALLVLFAGFCQPGISFSQEEKENPMLMGDIELEDTEEQVVDTYAVALNSSIEYFNHLSDLTARLAEGGAPEQLKDLNEGQFQLITSLYLDCSINRGSCPMVLDALYEIDLVNSKIRNNSECPNLTTFWRTWMKNDMERRHDYMVKTPYLSISAEFKQKTRPRYVRCKDTIAKEISGSFSLQDFFKARYQGDSYQREAIRQTAAMLKTVQDKGINVIKAAGLKVAPPVKSKTDGKKGGRSGKGSSGTAKRTVK